MEIVVHNKFQQKFQMILCFNKSFKRNCTVSTGIHNLEYDFKNDPIGHSESKSDKKIRLRLPVLLGIRLHSKTSDSGSDSTTLVYTNTT